MRSATDGPRRDKLLILLDATTVADVRRADHALLFAYVDDLARGLDDELVIVCAPRDAERLRTCAPRAIVVVGPRALHGRAFRRLWQQFALPRIARRHDVDAVHSPHAAIPLLIARPRVVTVLELSAFGDAGRRPRWRDAAARESVRIATRFADEIIALDPAAAAALESVVGFRADDVLIPPRRDDLDRFAAAHRVAYRAAAALMPVATGPVTIAPHDKQAEGPH